MTAVRADGRPVDEILGELRGSRGGHADGLHRELTEASAPHRTGRGVAARNGPASDGT